MATMEDRKFKMLVTAGDDAKLDQLANDLHLARVELLQENPIFSENLNFVRYDYVQHDFPNVQNYTAHVQLEATNEKNLIKRQEIYKKIISETKILFCPFRKLFNLNK